MFWNLSFAYFLVEIWYEIVHKNRKQDSDLVVLLILHQLAPFISKLGSNSIFYQCLITPRRV